MSLRSSSPSGVASIRVPGSLPHSAWRTSTRRLVEPEGSSAFPRASRPRTPRVSSAPTSERRTRRPESAGTSSRSSAWRTSPTSPTSMNSAACETTSDRASSHSGSDASAEARVSSPRAMSRVRHAIATSGNSALAEVTCLRHAASAPGATDDRHEKTERSVESPKSGAFSRMNSSKSVCTCPRTSLSSSIRPCPSKSMQSLVRRSSSDNVGLSDCSSRSPRES